MRGKGNINLYGVWFRIVIFEFFFGFFSWRNVEFWEETVNYENRFIFK